MNLLYFFLFGILILFIMALISNSGTDSTLNIQDQIYLMNCPFPVSNAIATDVGLNDFGISYNLDYGSSVLNNTGTFFQCTVTAPHLKGVSTTIKEYGATLFSVIPYGWFGFAEDYISVGLGHLGNFFTIVSYMVTPVNFSLMGYTISNVGGMALLIIIGIYVFAYIGIGAFLSGYIVGLIQRII